MRVLPIATAGVSVIMAALAVSQIVESPGAIDDVGDVDLAPSPGDQTVDVAIVAGANPRDIGKTLEDAGVIDSTTQFSILVALLGYDGQLQAGDYEFSLGMAELDAVYRIRRGIVTTRSVTVVEGWRLEEIAVAVATQGISREEFVSQARVRNFDFEFLDGLRSSTTLEGYLYPATYSIRRDETADSVLTKMLEAFSASLPPDVRERARESGLTLHEVVTIASIIEREARLDEERPIMAQVFLRRLRQGIPLEADPTVQYAIASDPESVEEYGWWKRALTLEDLEVDSPYNTYANDGTPPGPICSPRISSIMAVLQPADTNYLYFVAKPDGSHAFASTLEEHQQNIDLYLR